MTLDETFDQLDWATIASYVELKQEEHLHLDFKTLKNVELTSGDDRRNIARCISGFANSSGGIIIWGIDARKNSDGVDCATAIVELRKPAVLVSRLNTLSGDATSPIIDGLRHKPIENSTSGGGVVATFVPETDGGPYMALLGEQRYYKRSGDSFYQMEHFDLEDMFGRRQKPNLEIFIEPLKVENGLEDYSILVGNNGRAVARHAGFLMTLQNVEIKSVNGAGLNKLSHVNAGRPVVGWNNAIGVIHPNGIRVNLGSIGVSRTVPEKKIRADVTLYCEGARVVKTAIEIEPLL
jgi:Putative DNA-binding domain